MMKNAMLCYVRCIVLDSSDCSFIGFGIFMSDVYVQPTTLVLLFNEKSEVLLGLKKR